MVSKVSVFFFPVKQIRWQRSTQKRKAPELPNEEAKIRSYQTNSSSSDQYAPTYLEFQRDAELYTSPALVQDVIEVSNLEDANAALIKLDTEADNVVISDQTIFHPQGGGQPSDVGTMQSIDGHTIFKVALVRMDVMRQGRVLHFGRFSSSSASQPTKFTPGEKVLQNIDIEKRLLYSRYHTAGHVLGAAVRHILETQVPGFDELKASHFPDSASCEFQGLIEGKWKEDIQKKVDEYIAANMSVEIDWWGEEDFVQQSLQRLIPDSKVFQASPDRKLRVVKIVGAEVYPCGGTHVGSTELCGKTLVKKISRQKGNSKVSYSLNDSKS